MADIFRLSEAASLALHAAAYLQAHGDQRPSAAAVAAELHVSVHHLAKVLQRMAHAGLVESVRGPKGGFRLVRPGNQITLLDIYEAMEGPLAPRPCLLGSRPLCAYQECLLGPLNLALHKRVRSYFATQKLSSFVRRAEKIGRRGH